MQFNLIIVGDEILHGTRADAHFAFFKQTLADCGFKLRSVTYLPDDEAILVQHFQRSFADSIATFVTGGIGATPDDFTRQAVAKALDLPLILHPEAAEIIKQLTLARGDSLDSAEHQQRLNLARFAEGVDLIPNPYNSVAGFSIREHYFFPGFPVMAQPMARWVLDTYYAEHFHQYRSEQKAVYLLGQAESKITPIMEKIEREFVGVRTFSLPSVACETADGKTVPAQIEFGIKAENQACEQLDAAWQVALSELANIQAIMKDTPFEAE